MVNLAGSSLPWQPIYQLYFTIFRQNDIIFIQTISHHTGNPNKMAAKIKRKVDASRSEAKSDSLAAIDRQLADLGLEVKLEDECEEESEAIEEPDKGENVKVMLRCRPLLKPNEKESCVTVNETEKYVELLGGERRLFFFDATFGPESDNDSVYMKSARNLVEFAFKGYNCTLFLYGQTGTGKTFTHSSLTSSSFAHLFDLIKESNKRSNFLVRASYYELYNETIRDLLSCKGGKQSKALELHESKTRGVYIKDLTCFLVNNVAELEKLKRIGDKRRSIAATKMNEYSSRSHSIFSITIETVVTQTSATRDSSGSTKSDGSRGSTASRSSASSIKKSTGQSSVKVGRINLIDLAGSERQAKSESTGARLKEASRINLSLTCLSLVIRALTDSKSEHIPYRNSKLTRLLSGSLGGNSKTMLIACISPAKSSLDETLNTLRFASRTKKIKNKAIVNEDPKDALLKKYRRQIEELRKKLREQQVGKGQGEGLDEDATIESLVASSTHDDKQQEALLQQLRLLRAKIMVGGENLLDKAEMHQKLLDASKREIEEKRNAEIELKLRLEKKREAIEKMTQSKGTLEGQVLELDEKLRRALLIYKKCKEEQKDLHGEHQQLKENLLQSIKATSKEIKYADSIIGDFIPREYLDLIDVYAQYDDESDEWQIKYIALSGNNIAQTRKMTNEISGSSNG